MNKLFFNTVASLQINVLKAKALRLSLNKAKFLGSLIHAHIIILHISVIIPNKQCYAVPAAV